MTTPPTDSQECSQLMVQAPIKHLCSSEDQNKKGRMNGYSVYKLSGVVKRIINNPADRVTKTTTRLIDRAISFNRAFQPEMAKCLILDSVFDYLLSFIPFGDSKLEVQEILAAGNHSSLRFYLQLLFTESGGKLDLVNQSGCELAKKKFIQRLSVNTSNLKPPQPVVQCPNIPYAVQNYTFFIEENLEDVAEEILGFAMEHSIDKIVQSRLIRNKLPHALSATITSNQFFSSCQYSQPSARRSGGVSPVSLNQALSSVLASVCSGIVLGAGNIAIITGVAITSACLGYQHYQFTRQIQSKN